jgi:hypothetical protein
LLTASSSTAGFAGGVISSFNFIHTNNTSPQNARTHWSIHEKVSEASPSTPRYSSSSSSQRILYKDVNIDKWRMRLLTWLIEDHIPFAQVDSKSFRDVLLALHEPIRDHLPGRKAVRRWIDNEFVYAVDSVQQWMKTASSWIHISFDI